MSFHPPPAIALTIAGFDPSSGAGITADLQAFAAHGIFGTSCISALTVQSTLGVRDVQTVAETMLATLHELNADLSPAGIKIGMLGSEEGVISVARFLREISGRNIPVVLDPVLRSSSGAMLLSPRGLAAMKRELLPLVGWVTPNLEELADLSPASAADAEGTMWGLQQLYPNLNVVATGGESTGTSTIDQLLTEDGNFHTFEGERIATTSTHGTGCAFSSALLSRLIQGHTPTEAVAAAKEYVTEALRQAPGLGHGRGPMHLLWPLTGHLS